MQEKQMKMPCETCEKGNFVETLREMSEPIEQHMKIPRTIVKDKQKCMKISRKMCENFTDNT